MMTLEGKVGLVTGGASGIGLAIAQTLAGAGACLVVADIVDERAEATVAALGGPERAMFARANIADGGEVREAIRATLDRFGSLDILVNNAGLQYVAPIVEYPEEKWQQLLEVMLTGTFLCTKYALPAMQDRGWGRVLNIASGHGLIASPFKSAYVAAKHGIVGFTKVLALETAQTGITANAICPGYVRTPLVEAQLEDQARVRGMNVEEVVEKVIFAATPQRRFVEPAEIAALALFLCSEEARSITGAAVSIDGGWTVQ